MPKVLDPNKFLSEFIAIVTAVQSRYTKLHGLLANESDRVELRRGLAMDMVFRVGVEWEVLQHQWHIAAINKRPKTLIEQQYKVTVDAVNASRGPKVLEVFAPTVRKPRHLNLVQVNKVLDAAGRNITFTNSSDWVKEAKKQLDPSYSDLVKAAGAPPANACVLDLLKGLRNATGHQSAQAMKHLGSLVKKRQQGARIGISGTINEPLVRAENGIGNIGAYLEGRAAANGQTRALFLCSRVVAIAKLLEKM